MRAWASMILGVSTGILGWFTAVGVYLFPEWRLIGPLFFLLVPQFLIWSSTYLLSRPFLRSWALPAKVLVTGAAYLLVGAIMVGIAAALRPFPGYPLGVIPYWPVGVVFTLFSERFYEPQELILLFAVGIIVVLAAGLVASLLQFRYTQRKEPAMGGPNRPE